MVDRIPGAEERGQPECAAADLLQLAQEARWVQLGCRDERAADSSAVTQLQSALELAVDAESAPEQDAAVAALGAALHALQGAALHVDARVSAIEVEGALGTATMPVLSAVVASRPASS